MQAVGTTGLVLDLWLGFDGLGRLTDMHGSAAGQSLGARSFDYDGLGRLVRAIGPWEADLHGDEAVTWSYRYDALGNLVAQESSGDYERSFAYADPAHPRFLTGFQTHGAELQTIASNAAGEPAAIDGQPLVWNAGSRLHQPAGSAERLYYDALGRRTRRTLEDGTSIIRVGDDFEYDTASGRARKWFVVNGERIASRDTSYSPSSSKVWNGVSQLRRAWETGRTGFVAALLVLALTGLAAQVTCAGPPAWLVAPGVALLAALLVLPAVPAQGARGGKKARGEPLLVYATDHLGSVRVILDADGEVLGTRDYLPFGGDLQRAGAPGVTHGFAGQPRDATTGLQQHGARLYHSHWARFLSPDEGLESFDPVGVHPYAYARQQPTSRIDPEGGSSVGFALAASNIGGVGFAAGGYALSVLGDRLGPGHPAGPLVKGFGVGLVLAATTLTIGLAFAVALAAGSTALLVVAALLSIAAVTALLHQVLIDLQTFRSQRSLSIRVETAALRLSTPAIAFSPPRSPAGARVVSARYDGASFVVRYANGSTRSVDVAGDASAGTRDPRSDLWGEAPGTQGPATKQQSSTEAIADATRVGPGYGNVSQQIARVEWIAAGGGNWVGF
jgi:RHS repeat-associated protein